MIIRRLTVLAVAASLAATILTPPASAADTTTDLGVTLTWGDGDLAVAGGKVFISTGDQIVVANTQGQPTDSITGLSHVAGLAARPDGTRLYAALAGSNEVAEIDTATLAIARRIAIPAHPCPTHLALTGDRLWVGYGCAGQWQGGVLALDLSAATPAPSAFGRRHYDAPTVTAAGSTLVVGESGSSPSDLIIYDIAGATPVLRGEVDGYTTTNSFFRDVALTADGGNAISACWVPANFINWNTTTFASVREYGGSTYEGGTPVSVAISSDDARVAAGRFGSTDVAVYDVATGATIFSGDNPAGLSTEGGLVFSGSDVYALLMTWSTKQLHLWRIQGLAT